MRILKHKRWILTTLISAAVIASFLLIPGLPKPVDAVALIRPAINYLNDLLDVNAPAPADNDIIYWNNTSGYWEVRAEDIFACSDLASCSINELHDVLVTPTSKWIVFFNISTTRWESQALSNWDLAELGTKNLDNLDDVNAPAPNDSDIIFWNNTASEWQTKAESGGAFNCTDLDSCNLTALGNVNTSFLANYDFLIYNNYTGMWENEILSSVALQVGANLGLHQLGNVNASLLDNYIIYWDNGASEFRMRLESTFSCGDLASCNISSLAYVNVTSPANDDILFWNNTASEWQSKVESVFSCSDLNTCNISELANVNATSPSDGDFLSYSTGLGYWQDRQLADTDIPAGIKAVGIIFIIDGIGAAITTGEKGHLEIPFNCTIQQVTMVADQTGSIVVDIWKDTYANFPPTNADTITSVTPPTITTAQKSQDSTLTNWTTTITTGDILAYNVDSCTNITRITISLQAVKT